MPQTIRNVEPIDVSTLDPSREDAIIIIALKINDLIYQLNLIRHTLASFEARLTVMKEVQDAGLSAAASDKPAKGTKGK